MIRFTVAGFLTLIAVLAVGLAAMKDPSDLKVTVVFSLSILSLLVGLLGAIVRSPRGAWAGYAMFGLGYYLSGCFSPFNTDQTAPRLPTLELVHSFVDRLHVTPPPPPLPFEQGNSEGGDPHGKIVDGVWVPFTPEELQMFLDYVKKRNLREVEEDSFIWQKERSEQIGHLLLCHIFGFFGALLGKIMEVRSDPLAGPSPEASRRHTVHS